MAKPTYLCISMRLGLLLEIDVFVSSFPDQFLFRVALQTFSYKFPIKLNENISILDYIFFHVFFSIENKGILNMHQE